MSGYGYAYRGYAAYSQVPPTGNERSEANYASEHVRRPVTIDADGQKVPILLSIPNQESHTYVAKVETVVEHVRVPVKEYVYRDISVEPAQDYGYRYSSPPKVGPVNHYGYKAEPGKDYGYKAEPMKDYGYKAELGKDYGYKAEPVKDYGYKAEPVKDYGYKPQPVREYGSKPEPVKDYGYEPEPVEDYGYKPEPVKEYGYKAEPVRDYGYKAEPGRDYGYKAEPARDYGYKAEPGKDYGYKAEPAKGYGYKAEPEKGYGYKAEPVKGYGDKAEPVKGYGYKAEPEKEYGYKAEPEKDSAYKVEPGQLYGRKLEPAKVYNYASDKLRSPPSPTRDRPQEVEEFITKVQTDASRPNRFAPVTAAKWRQSPNSNGQTGTTGYGDYNDYSNKDRQKPSENAIRNENKDATLGKPTSDIATAVENLKEAVRTVAIHTAPPARYTVPVSTGPIRNGKAETIDSREAARRYGNRSSRPEMTGGTYTTTIDNKEAARKYGGKTI